MRNKAFLVAACGAVMFGCGGGHHHKSSSSTAGSTTGGGMTVTLDRSYGRVEVAYLTGPGRAAGDLYLEITRQRIQNGDGVDVVNRTDGNAPLDLNLSGFQNVSVALNVPFALTTSGLPNSFNYTQFIFDPNRVLQENSDNSLSESYSLPSNLPAVLDARIRAFPGRNALVQVYVSTAAFNVDSDTGTFVFDDQTFRDLNYSQSETDPDSVNRIASRLNDFIRFPLSGLAAADLPAVRTDYGSDDDPDPTSGPSVPAAYVYFSGDNIALSDGNSGSASHFQELTNDPTQILLGKWAAGSANGFRGTFDLRGANPVLIEGGLQRLIAEYGAFRDFTDVLSGGSGFDIVMFPNSSERYGFEGTTDLVGRDADIVGIVHTGTKITAMYFGGVDLVAGTFSLLPIKYLGTDPADPTLPTIGGTVSGYRDGNGNATSDYASVRNFSYAFTNGITGVPASGTATVFR